MIMPRKQRGVALILLLTIIVLVSSGIFLRPLARILSYPLQHAEKTTIALLDAKQALIGWAVSHPNAPGLMPWPDRNGDGNYDGDSDCASLSTNATFNPAFLLGRLPWRGRTNPCERVHGGLGIEVRDSAGERLWYAVSRNLIRRYQSPAGYPTINPELANSAPFPWLTVRDGEGAVISDQVAAVILAPGMAFGAQNRSGGAPNAGNYLDIHARTGIGNADSDGCFDNNPGCGGTDGEEFILADPDGAFNDRLVFITIEELMRNVERRVLNEVDTVLDRHRESSGVYPWVSPFAYPPAMVSGSVTENGTDTSRILIDSRDFIAAGVRSGQVIRNITDGSKGIIETVDSRTELSLTMQGLRHGEDNRFEINSISNPDDNDRYEILVDTSGVATDGQGNTLQDTNPSVNFGTLGIRVGDLVENVSDETYGVVMDIPDSNTLTLQRLGSDETMAFDPGDGYEIPRFNGIPNTWEGALPFHATGERFRTGFTVAWKLPAGVMEMAPLANTPLANNSQYLLALEKALRCSGMPAPALMPDAAVDNCVPNRPPVTVLWANGSCSWGTMDSVRCEGRTDWDWYLAGTVTGNYGVESLKFTDANTDFQDRGVAIGDVILNTTDGSYGVITSVANHELQAVLSGTGNDFQIGDQYRIRVATRILPERIANCAHIADGGQAITCDSRTLVDIGIDFYQNGVRPGDTIHNRSKGWWAIIEEVGRPSAVANTKSVLRVESMSGTQTSGFAHGDRYIIRSGFVDKRRYAFHLLFSGGGTIERDTGLRTVETGADASLPAQNDIRIQDSDAINGSIVVDAAIKTNPATATDGEIRVSGIQLDLVPDFPSWFLRNRWHEYIYMAVSPAYLPGGNGDCTLNHDCLTLNTVNPGGVITRADIQALIISAGSKTHGPGCLQARPAFNPNQYLEKENVHPDGNFSTFTFAQRHQRLSGACFRDEIKIVAP